MQDAGHVLVSRVSAWVREQWRSPWASADGYEGQSFFLIGLGAFHGVSWGIAMTSAVSDPIEWRVLAIGLVSLVLLMARWLRIHASWTRMLLFVIVFSIQLTIRTTSEDPFHRAGLLLITVWSLWLFPSWMLAAINSVVALLLTLWLLDAAIPTVMRGSLVGLTLVYLKERNLRQMYSLQKDKEWLIADLRNALDRAQTIMDEQRKFVAFISHELRTPMNSILGFSDLALKETKPGTQLRQDLERVGAAGRRLLKLIDDLLALAETAGQAPHAENERFGLRELVDECIELLNSEIVSSGNVVLVEVPESATIVSDRAKISHIIRNVLLNALKYTKHGRVTLRSKQEVFEGRTFTRMEVQDTGMGMSPEAQEASLEAFKRGPEAATIAPGLGIGLAVSAQIAEWLGGRFEARHANPGTLVLIWLPQGDKISL